MAQLLYSPVALEWSDFLQGPTRLQAQCSSEQGSRWIVFGDPAKLLYSITFATLLDRAVKSPPTFKGIEISLWPLMEGG